MEAQFDFNVKLKTEINGLKSSMLRSQPLGLGKSGTVFWTQRDTENNFRVYKQNSKEDKWEFVTK